MRHAAFSACGNGDGIDCGGGDGRGSGGLRLEVGLIDIGASGCG